MRQLLTSLAAGTLLACTASAAAPGHDEIYTRPGQLIPAGDGARLNFYCTGSGSPTVVFEGGFTDWAPAWATVQPRIARFTRACSYDRAGAGFREPGPMPRTTERIARELHDALHAGGIDGPYILVGHAFGGDHVRAFADLFLEDMAGLVLVEADASDVEGADMRKQDDEGGQGLSLSSRRAATGSRRARTRRFPAAPASHRAPVRSSSSGAFRSGTGRPR